MMKQTVRSFAIGLMAAGIILLGAFYFAGHSQTDVADIPQEDMIEAIESDGYHVLTDSQYISASVEDKANDDQKENQSKNQDESAADDAGADKNSGSSNEQDDQENSSQDSSENSPSTYTLTVESGTASSSISQTLEDHNIIDDAGAFNQYLADENYGEEIQLGEFELSSDMNHQEIAETLTN